MPVGAENLDLFFQDFGVSVESGDVVTRGILDTVADNLDLAGVNVHADALTLTYITESLPDLQRESGVKVDGVDYTVRSVDHPGDGKISHADLKKGPPNAVYVAPPATPKHRWGRVVLTSQIDGARSTFTLPVAADPTVISVIWNQETLASTSFNLGGTTLTLLDAAGVAIVPPVGDSLEVFC